MKSLRFSIAVLALAMSAFSLQAGTSGELRQAERALATRDYSKAFSIYRRLAEREQNPDAQLKLASFYLYGWGRPADQVQACRWFEKAARRELAEAAYFLAGCLYQGVHQPADAAQAAHWYRTAADLGYDVSLCALAELYMTGEGVVRDPAKGLALCQQAAERGVLSAMNRLGRFYLEGDGEIRDYAAARHWFNAGAQRMSAESQYLLAVMLRDGLGQDEDPFGARLWFESAASQGYTPAYYPCAELYYRTSADVDSGAHSEHDLAKAYLWFSAALVRSTDPQERSQAALMLGRVRELMPENWVVKLDGKVAEHLAAHTPKP